MNIIKLTSLDLADTFQSADTGNYCPCRSVFEVGYPMYVNQFGSFNESDPKVISIDALGKYIWYEIMTSDGHKHIMPANAYIAEWTPEKEASK
jgi:hypothetical protein